MTAELTPLQQEAVKECLESLWRNLVDPELRTDEGRKMFNETVGQLLEKLVHKAHLDTEAMVEVMMAGNELVEALKGVHLERPSKDSEELCWCAVSAMAPGTPHEPSCIRARVAIEEWNRLLNG